MKLVAEQFTSIANRDAHLEHHKVQYPKITVEEYEQIADDLQRAHIDNKNIFGYVNEYRDGRLANCKYNRETQDFVVYTIKNGTPYTITMYKKSWKDYTGDKAISYYDEIDE